MTAPDKDLSPTIAQAILDAVAPGSAFQSAQVLTGSFSNYTHRVDFTAAGGSTGCIVVRRYNPAGGDPGAKAALEYQTLVWLHANGIPVAEPLHLDPDGALLGAPGFVMRFLRGAPVFLDDKPAAEITAWARKSAAMLARIHAVPLDPCPPFLHDNNQLALWFTHSGEMPAYLRADPDGAAVWDAIHRYKPDFSRSLRHLIHLDYWAGNLLWEGGEISAVVDWEEAGCGEPGIDIAYALMELALVGAPESGEVFLQTYEELTGEPVAHLPFWELAAAVRPIHTPEGWIDHPPYSERHRAFVRAALARVGGAA